MIEFLKEVMKSVLFPGLVAIATLYAGTKFNESKSEKIENNETEKQKSFLYLKLKNLLNSISYYEDTVSRITTYRHEQFMLEEGKMEYDPEDYNGISKKDYLEDLVNQIDYLVDSHLPVSIDDVKLSYGSFTSCSHDKLSPKDSFKILSILEIGMNPSHLLENKNELIEAKDYFKPKYI